MPVTENQTRSRLSAELLEILQCFCRARLVEDGGGYQCPSCGRSFANERGVARFVQTDNYANSFGFQWQRYARTQLDDENCRESELDFQKKTGFTPDQLRGKLVLDVGCGTGRYAEVATRWGARVVGIDLSAAAEVAARNLHEREFMALQADVFAMPFALESFDYIYSIGVLHHTPDCESAVKALPAYLKPGGSLGVWLYSSYNKWYRFSDIYRKVTTRLSPQTLHSFLKVAVPVINGIDSGLRAFPVVGRPMSGIVRYVFPVNRNPQRSWRVLDTFDWYSPKYQSKHTYEQVFQWFEDCGMEDLRVGCTPIAVRGRKPFRTST